jgi:hypothetical protein
MVERYWQRAFGWKPMAATILLFVLGLVFVPDVAQRVRAAAYVEAATQTHRSYLNGELPLQCRSDSRPRLPLGHSRVATSKLSSRMMRATLL